MCGICGLALAPDERAEEGLLRRMAGVLAHRGPDEEGYYTSPRHQNVGLGHRRLSIIDLATGHQPLTNEDGTLWIVYNGEIYNFPDLRHQLEHAGHRFRTHSDTEVIVHLYEEYGKDCLAHLNGMFAFAIYDETKNELFLARDRLGQKPLVYSAEGGRFIFASEIKAILQVPGVAREVDERALHYYLTYQYVPAPMTMFRSVRKLPPAHWMTYKADGSIETGRYWTPDFSREGTLSFDDYAEQLRVTLEDATRIRLISDVPLGAFLSGGVDSSIVVGLMSRMSSEPVRTFSIGFDEKRFDETNYARLVAERYKTDHHVFTVKYDSIDVLPKLIWHYDEPFADSSAIPTYYVSKYTSEHVKVALTGDAGDETFAGYPRYHAVALAERWDRLPGFLKALAAPALIDKLPSSIEQKTLMRRLKRFASYLRCDPVTRYLRWIGIFDDDRKRALYTDSFARAFDPFEVTDLLASCYASLPTRDFLTATTYADILTYLPYDILVKVDIASMANGLETRSPFLDHRVVELAGRIPMRYKMQGQRDKVILKKACADVFFNKSLKSSGLEVAALVAPVAEEGLAQQEAQLASEP